MTPVILIEALVTACEQRRALGWTISVHGRKFGRKDVPSCCPLGALMDPLRPTGGVGDPFFEHPIASDVRDVPEARDLLTTEDAQAFIWGFDADASGSNEGTMLDLGRRFRQWYDAAEKESTLDALKDAISEHALGPS